MSVAESYRVDGSQEFAFTRSDFSFLAKLVHERTGIALSDSKQSMVYSRLARRLRELRLPSFADYCRLLQSPEGVQEMGNLTNAITTNLTRFMREPHHFAYLTEKVVPRAKAQGTQRLRVWSAGCSSGEEPYSIAMTLAAKAELSRWDVKILATDLDSNMVARGSAGRYPEASLEELGEPFRSRYFGRAEGGVGVIDAQIRRLITFKQLNLMGPWPMRGPFDVIFCRNVMIYFDQPTKERLIERFATLLEPGAFLFIGHSESLPDPAGNFEMVGRTAYRRRMA